jgi:hypothetical protein
MDNSNLDTASARDASGRFLPGQSGNPRGKKPGTRNRATAIREMLEEGEERAVARTVIDKATSGDGVAARFLLGLLCPRPRPRGRAIALALPDGARAGDTVAAFNAALQAMAVGEITPEEALTVTQMLDGRLKALNAFKLQRELTQYRGDFIRGDELFLPAEERFREPGEDAVEDEAAEDETEEEEAGGDDEEEVAVAPATQTEPSPACSQRGFATPDAAAGTSGPRESGRGQGEGSRDTCDRDDSDASGSPHPNPLPQAGEGMMGTAADNSPENPLHPQAAPPAAADEDLHSACIELDLEADSAARCAAQRKLAQWGHLIATEPGFNAEAYIAAEIQRSAALKRSSAAPPGHNSRSPRALNGVGTVLR